MHTGNNLNLNLTGGKMATITQLVFGTVDGDAFCASCVTRESSLGGTRFARIDNVALVTLPVPSPVGSRGYECDGGCGRVLSYGEYDGGTLVTTAGLQVFEITAEGGVSDTPVGR
jgi:hypothetical protein